MSTATIVAPVGRHAIEIDNLAIEIFASTFGIDWAAADALAADQVDELLAYAEEWDCEAQAAGNPAAQCPF